MTRTDNANLVKQIRAARRAGVPLLAIATPDPGATIQTVVAAVNGDGPKIAWDVVSGMRALNDAAKPVIATAGEIDPTVNNPTGLLLFALKLQRESLLFVHLANRWLVDPIFVQACWNLRDKFKLDERTLVLLGPSIELPAELAGDVIVLDEPLPGADQLAEIVRDQHEAARLKGPQDKQVTRAVEAIQGLPAFQAEQVVAMSLTRDGVDLDGLWERKRQQIELTPGLKVHREQVTFKDVGGLATIKKFLGAILTGKSRPNAIIFVDEIEKAMAGAGGDTSGVSQDQLGQLLTYMQDHAAAGMIFVGPPGSGKSQLAKCAGNEAGIPTIQLDLGGMRGSLVGQSESNLRSALKVITSVSNGRSLWVATSNNIAELPPELRRRFGLGTFFYDLPTEDERASIWRVWQAKYKVAGPLPEDAGWTGAEIRQACDIAYRLGCTLREAAEFVVPVSRSAVEQIDKLRRAAAGRFLSASKPGVYQLPGSNQDEPVNAKPARRTLQLEK